MSEKNNNTLLTEETIEQAQYDKVEESAQYLKVMSTQFKRAAYALGDRKKRSLARVLEAVLFEPLEEVKLYGAEEQKMLDLCKQILYHKNTVSAYALERHMKDEENKQENSNE